MKTSSKMMLVGIVLVSLGLMIDLWTMFSWVSDWIGLAGGGLCMVAVVKFIEGE